MVLPYELPKEFSIFHYGRIMELFTEKMRDFTPPLGSYHLPYKDADKSLIKKQYGKRIQGLSSQTQKAFKRSVI